MRNPSEAVARHLRLLGFICFAVIWGVVAFGAVVFFLLRGGSYAPPQQTPGYLGPTLNLVALLLLLKAVVLPRFFGPRPPVTNEEALIAWHRKSVIVGFALREGAGLLALVGVLLTGNAGAGFAIAGLAMVSMVLAWPRIQQLRD